MSYPYFVKYRPNNVDVIKRLSHNYIEFMEHNKQKQRFIVLYCITYILYNHAINTWHQ